MANGERNTGARELPEALLALLATLPDGAYISDEDCRLLYVNPALEGHFGPCAGGSCFEYLYGLDHPCESCNNREIFAGSPSRREIWFPRVGRCFDVVEAPFQGAGGRRLKVSLLRDVTQQKLNEDALRDAEAFFRNVHASMGEGLIVLDTDLVYRLWNRRIEEMTGLEAGKVLGRKAIEVFPDLREKGMLDRMERALAGETVPMPDLHYVTPGVGKAAWYTGLYTPRRNAAGEIVGVVIVLSEITRYKQVEADLLLRDRISRAFLASDDGGAYQTVLDISREATGSPFGFLGHLDDSGALVCPTLTKDVWDRCQVPGKSIVFPREVWGGLWGRALEEGRLLVQNEGLTPPPGHIPLRRALCAPILHGATLLGLIAVADKATDYTPEDQSFLSTIAENVAPHLDARMQRDHQARGRALAEDALGAMQRRLTGETAYAGIVGRTQLMQDLFTRIREVASSEVPVVLEGESGSGKELVAMAIHAASSRGGRQFVAVNCSALPEGLIESELFGHVRGAFTGALRDKKGRFELADGGTLFLDEVGDLAPSVQVSLLRVLQERVIERVGDEATRPVDVRVISASHQDLRKLVAARRFREDLFYRLSVIPIRVPPLRERVDDIPLLVDHILGRIAAETGGRKLRVSTDALDILTAWSWPGNVRELQNTLHFANVRCRSSVLHARDLPPTLLARKTSPALPPASRGRRPKLTREIVRQAVAKAGGNRARAAQALGVSRTTLYRYLPES
jgi:PAS domain S-box-containing protein